MSRKILNLRILLALFLGAIINGAALSQEYVQSFTFENPQRHLAHVSGLITVPILRNYVAEIPAGRFGAFIFLYNNSEGRKICQKIEERFGVFKQGDRVIGVRPIIFPAKQAILDGRLHCADLGAFYHQSSWSDYSSITDAMGNTPFIMIIFRDNKGSLRNCGYLDFKFTRNDDEINWALTHLENYVRRDPYSWVEGERLWVPKDKGILTTIRDIAFKPSTCLRRQ